MTKRVLYLVRHAKSSWKDESLPDRLRPLNKRGHKNAVDMASRLASKKIRPDLMISSPAKRALTTAQYFASEMDYPNFDIKVDERLYFCGLKGQLKALKDIEDGCREIMIFGHNPDISELLNKYTNDSFDPVPTCTVAKLVFRMDHWEDASKSKAELKFIDAPKRAPEATSLNF